MRIAINIDDQFYNMTGIQHYVDNLLSALYNSGTNHNIYGFAPTMGSFTALKQCTRDGLFTWRKQLKARVRTAGSAFQLTELPLLKRGAPFWSLAERLERRILDPLKEYTFELRVRAATSRYDLLHTVSPAALYFEISQAKQNVVTIYDLTTRICPWAHTSVNIAIWERLFNYAQRRCARVLTISEASKRDIVEHLQIPEDRIDVTPLAAKTATHRIDDKQALRQSLSYLGLADTPFILYTGTLEPRKNLDRLLKAFNQVIAESGLPEYKLVLAGGAVNQYDRKMLDLSQELGISERVMITGYVSNQMMNTLMSACTAFVYVSQYEGFGLPPLEAMTCGAPVITSNVSSLPEVVGEAGIQVSPSDTRQIAEAIHLLLTDSVENARRRKLSLERAQGFTWERTAALTLRSYEAAAS